MFSKTKSNTKENTPKNTHTPMTKRDRYNSTFHLRVNKDWKERVKIISQMNNTSFSNFIRESVDRNIQSLSR